MEFRKKAAREAEILIQVSEDLASKPAFSIPAGKNYEPFQPDMSKFNQGQGGDAANKAAERQAAQAAKLQEALDNQYASVKSSLFNEEEALSASYAERGIVVGEWLQTHQDKVSEANETLLKLDAEYAERMLAIREKANADKNRLAKAGFVQDLQTSGRGKSRPPLNSAVRRHPARSGQVRHGHHHRRRPPRGGVLMDLETMARHSAVNLAAQHEFLAVYERWDAQLSEFLPEASSSRASVRNAAEQQRALIEAFEEAHRTIVEAYEAHRAQFPVTAH